MIVLWIALGIIVLVAIGAVTSYNRFVSQRNAVRSSWADIDTELKRRYDLIPNLVETVKGYAAHEREIFEEVASTRAAAASAGGSPAQQAAAEGPFVAALGRLFAVAENYPDLKANQNFLALQQELANTEDRIQAARRFYNANVQDYNRRIQSFPSSLIASTGRFTPAEFFEIPEAERAVVAEAPKVDFSFAAPAAPQAPPASAPSSAPTPPPPPAPPPADPEPFVNPQDEAPPPAS